MLISSQPNTMQIAKPLEEFLSVTNYILILPLKCNKDVASPKGEWQKSIFLWGQVKSYLASWCILISPGVGVPVNRSFKKTTVRAYFQTVMFAEESKQRPFFLGCEIEIGFAT